MCIHLKLFSRKFLIEILSLLFVCLQSAMLVEAQTNSVIGSRPNVIYILADDLGIGDIEPFGQRYIKTPNLNRMMNEGMVLLQHYAGNTVCAPSRASLMTGLHSGHGQIRGNFELGGFTDEEEFGQMPLNPGLVPRFKAPMAFGIEWEYGDTILRMSLPTLENFVTWWNPWNFGLKMKG